MLHVININYKQATLYSLVITRFKSMLEKRCDRNEQELPLSSQLAKRYLAIQAICSPSKRLFSKAGFVSAPAPAQLKP